MFTRTIRFSEMQAQRRWKVEFFVSDHEGSKSTTYPLVALKEVFNERKEFLDPQQHSDHTFNYIGLEHIETLTGDLIDSYEPRSGRDVLSRCKVFREGDVLYGRLRPVLNKVFVADSTLPEGICSGEFYVLIPDSKRVLPQFARALLASRYVQEVVKSMTTGSALPRLQLSDLLDVEVPLPTLEKQREFESLLIEQRRRRTSLRAEVIYGPGAIIDSLVESLESGTEPVVDLEALHRLDSFADHRLPRASVDGRRRGRPKIDKQLAIDLPE